MGHSFILYRDSNLKKFYQLKFLLAFKFFIFNYFSVNQVKLLTPFGSNLSCSHKQFFNYFIICSKCNQYISENYYFRVYLYLQWINQQMCPTKTTTRPRRKNASAGLNQDFSLIIFLRIVLVAFIKLLIHQNCMIK